MHSAPLIQRMAVHLSSEPHSGVFSLFHHVHPPAQVGSRSVQGEWDFVHLFLNSVLTFPELQQVWLWAIHFSFLLYSQHLEYGVLPKSHSLFLGCEHLTLRPDEGQAISM